MRIVVALGGNALLKRGEPMSADLQRANVGRAAQSLAALAAAGHQIVVTHGNGPQVGLIALQSAAGPKDGAYPLDILGAESQGLIGYLIEQALREHLPPGTRLATLLTQVRVDPQDPAFGHPSKPIGPVYSQETAVQLAARNGWRVAQDGAGWRRVVPSPKPQEILAIGVISQLVDLDVTVICAGGGGVPVVGGEGEKTRGVEAVIDKDLTSGLLAREIGADLLLMLTDVDAVYLDFGKPGARAIVRAGAEALAGQDFAAGSMGPKIAAARGFVATTGKAAAIGRVEDAAAILDGLAGTWIGPGDAAATFDRAPAGRTSDPADAGALSPWGPDARPSVAPSRNAKMKTPHPPRSSNALFERAQVGAFDLANRIVMAPLTRNRAGPGLTPGVLAAEYYGQRASAGLIIAEATQVSAQAQGYSDTPGCYSDAQVAGWRKVTDAVHVQGGTIVLQLWHTGRVSHTSFQPDGRAPVAPSALRANTKTFIAGQGFVDVSTPRALELAEIPGVVADFRNAAARAIEAGFDGVELHGAHGYLLDAFLRDGVNRHTDAYGGSIENRARLLLEVTEAVAGTIGADRVGVRLSPVSPANDASDSDPQPLFNAVVEGLNRFGLAYVHVVEGATGEARDYAPFDYQALRDRFDGAWMVNNGYDRQMAIDVIADGRADLVSFGRAFIANPDLVRRLRENAPLNALMDPATLYGGGAHGYTDYPTLAAPTLVR